MAALHNPASAPPILPLLQPLRMPHSLLPEDSRPHLNLGDSVLVAQLCDAITFDKKGVRLMSVSYFKGLKSLCDEKD